MSEADNLLNGFQNVVYIHKPKAITVFNSEIQHIDYDKIASVRVSNYILLTN